MGEPRSRARSFREGCRSTTLSMVEKARGYFDFRHRSQYPYGGLPTTFSAYNDTQSATPDVWTLHQKFFSTDVDPGQHTFTVIVGETIGSGVHLVSTWLLELMESCRFRCFGLTAFPLPPLVRQN